MQVIKVHFLLIFNFVTFMYIIIVYNHCYSMFSITDMNITESVMFIELYNRTNNIFYHSPSDMQ